MGLPLNCREYLHGQGSTQLAIDTLSGQSNVHERARGVQVVALEEQGKTF